MSRNRKASLFAIALILAAFAAATRAGESLPSVLAAPLLSYGPDVTTTGAAYSCGEVVGNEATKAFDNNTAVGWGSSQVTQVTIEGLACIGQSFGAGYDIRQITIQQGPNANNRVSAAYWQYSDDGSHWHTISILTLPDDANTNTLSDLPVVGSHNYWRLMAKTKVNSTASSWSVREIEMMEAAGNPTATPVPTSTPPSATPTITLTPSTTPSPTPDIWAYATLSSGHAVAIQRSATFGEISQGIAIGLVLIMGGSAFLYAFWKRDARP